MIHKELEIPADMDHLEEVMSLLESSMEDAGVEAPIITKICIAAEEIYTNIASYAYDDKEGKVVVGIDISDEDEEVAISFSDSGKPYNPLDKPDPDITLSVEDRPIGGLGIYMTKKMMDDICYEYKDGRNILRFKKKV